MVSRGCQPNGAHISGAARAARCLEQCIPNVLPDSLRCSATKVSTIGCQPPDYTSKESGG